MAALEAGGVLGSAYPPPLPRHNDRMSSIFQNIKAFADETAEDPYLRQTPDPLGLRLPPYPAHPSYYDPAHNYFVSEDEPGPSHRYRPRDSFYGYDEGDGRFTGYSDYRNGYERPNLAARPSHRSTGIGPNEYFATRSPSPDYPSPPVAKPAPPTPAAKNTNSRPPKDSKSRTDSGSRSQDPNFTLRQKKEGRKESSNSIPLDLSIDPLSSLDDSLRKLRRAERERGSQIASSAHSSPLTSTASPVSTTQKKKIHRSRDPKAEKTSPSTSGTTESRKSHSKPRPNHEEQNHRPPDEHRLEKSRRKSEDQPVEVELATETPASVAPSASPTKSAGPRRRLQEEAFQVGVGSVSKESSSPTSSGQRPQFNLDGISRETDSLKTDNSGSSRKKGLLNQLPGFVKKLGRSSIGSQVSSSSPKSTTVDIAPGTSMPSLASGINNISLPSLASGTIKPLPSSTNTSLTRNSKHTLSMSEKNVQRLFDSTDPPALETSTATSAKPTPQPAPRERDGQGGAEGSGSTSLGSWNGGSVEDDGWTGWRGDQWRLDREINGPQEWRSEENLTLATTTVMGQGAARVSSTQESVDMVCQMCQGPKRPRAEFRPCPTCWSLYCPNCQWWCIMTKKQRCVQCYYNDAPVQADQP